MIAERFDRWALLVTVAASEVDADAARRNALRAALRSWRFAVDASTVDLPARRRRRMGLTREDVAELAGLSICWYTLFESGSTKHRCSPRAVDRVADALGLGKEDRAILQILASPEAFQSVRVILEPWILGEAVDAVGIVRT